MYNSAHFLSFFTEVSQKGKLVDILARESQLVSVVPYLNSTSAAHSRFIGLQSCWRK